MANELLHEGMVYNGIHHKKAKYIGIRYDSDLNMNLYQFEYVMSHNTVICGYGQTVNQVRAENYKLDESATVLYGNQRPKAY